MIKMTLRTLIAAGTLLLMSSHAYALCSNPSGQEGEVIYNSSSNVPQYCDGSDNWIAMVGSDPSAYQGTTDGIVGWWKFDDGDFDDPLIDSSVNGNHLGNTFGTDVITFPSGQIDGAIQLVTSRGLQKMSPAGLGDLDEVTISFWMNLDYAASTQTCIFNLDGAFRIEDTNFGDDDFGIYFGNWDGTSGYFEVDGAFTDNDNIWAHYAVTYSYNDAPGTQPKMYINGVPQTVITGIAPTGSFETVTPGSINFSRNNNSGATCDSSPDGIDAILDDFRIYNRVLSTEEVVGIYNGAATEKVTTIASDGLLGHWKLDEATGTTAVDSSASGNDGSMNNGLNADSESVAGVLGNGLAFDGGSQYRSIWASAPDNITDSGDVTIALWAKLEDDSGIDGIVTFGEMTTSGWVSLLRRFNSKALSFQAHSWTGGGYESYMQSTALVLGEWTHIAVTYSYNDPVNTDPKFYVNGVLYEGSQGGVNTSGTYSPTAPVYTFISRRWDSSTSAFNGSLDDVRIYDRVLSAAEIQALYKVREGIRYNPSQRTMEFNDGSRFVSMSPAHQDITRGLVGHWKLDEITFTSAADSSGNGLVGALYGDMDQTSDSIAGAVGKSYAFDGVDDYIEVATDAAFDVFPLTVAGWIKIDRLSSTAAVDQVLIYADSAGSGYAYKIQVDNNADSINFSVSDSSGTDFFVNSDSAAVVGRWYHVAGVIDANYDMTLYVDGVLQADTDNSVSKKAADRPLRFGEASGDILLGNLDDLRIYDRVLSAPEIQKLYNMGSPVGQTTSLPVGCSNIGDVCDDGTFYAGLSPDGSVAMFTTQQDQGTFAFNDGGSDNLVDTGINDQTTGMANTNSLVVTDSRLLAGFQTHNAAQACYDLVSNGADDWYLPATNELVLMYDNLVDQNGDNTPGGPLGSTYNFVTDGSRYRTSSQFDADDAYTVLLSDGSVSSTGGTSWGTYNVRCVRKGPAPRCANPYGLEGSMIYNTTYDVVQYCDGARWVAIGKNN